jgi:hypothetical protein
MCADFLGLGGSFLEKWHGEIRAKKTDAYNGGRLG